ncbi:hypothetical protein BT08F39_41290 [Escherichia coli]
MLLLFTAPGIKLGFIQAEFTGCGGHTDAFSEFQGLVTKFRRMLFTGLLAD